MWTSLTDEEHNDTRSGKTLLKTSASHTAPEDSDDVQVNDGAKGDAGDSVVTGDRPRILGQEKVDGTTGQADPAIQGHMHNAL